MHVNLYLKHILERHNNTKHSWTKTKFDFAPIDVNWNAKPSSKLAKIILIKSYAVIIFCFANI